MNLPSVLPTWNPDISTPVILYSSFFLTFGALVLFIEAAIVLRTLIMTRSPLRHYSLLALPLGAAILTYLVAMHGWQTYTDWQSFQSIIGEHITPFVLRVIRLRISNLTAAAIIGLLQSIFTIALFALTLILERKLLPRVKRPPLWTIVRRPRIV